MPATILHHLLVAGAGTIAHAAFAPLAALPFSLEYARRAALAALVIDLAALVSVWRSRGHSLKARLVWTALVGLLPVVGAGAWFVLGRERRAVRRRSA